MKNNTLKLSTAEVSAFINKNGSAEFTLTGAVPPQGNVPFVSGTIAPDGSIIIRTNTGYGGTAEIIRAIKKELSKK